MLANLGLKNAGLWNYSKVMNSAVTFTKVLWKTVLLVSGSPMAIHSQEDVNHFHSV